MRTLAMRTSALALLAFFGAAWGDTHVVTVEGMTFKPALLTVKQGDTVTWENRDVVPHTTTTQGLFDSRAIAPGAHWSWKASTKGHHSYACTFHPDMTGTVVVE